MADDLREPVHVLYGGAHLFRANGARRMGDLAREALDRHAGSAGSFAAIFGLPEERAARIRKRVAAKLATEPVEDLRIDFEDGYGCRADSEEDRHAEAAAGELRAGREAGTLPAWIGIRPKASPRGERTLRRFLAAAGVLPANFVVTIPKVGGAADVARWARLLDELQCPARLEIMVETPQCLFALRECAAAAAGRLVAAHFGAYDYTAALGIAAADQDLRHPACDFARGYMQAALSGSGVRVADGATNLLPVGDAVAGSWRAHFAHVTAAMRAGFFQSWDLHPAQLVSRYAAVYAFYDERVAAASERLRNFLERAAQATRVGGVFDDAATGQGLLNFFLRGAACGAFAVEQLPGLTGLSLTELRLGSFDKILEARR
jgi:citrate lyase beta subunit